MRLDRVIVPLLLTLGAGTAAAQETIPIEDLPEEVRRQIPPDAVLLGPARSDGPSLYDPPVVSAPSAAGPHAVAPDAIVFAQSAAVPEARRAADKAIRIGAPFDIDLAPGTVFGIFMQKDGPRPCRTRVPGESFEPPEDEKGEAYPSLCLVDADGDGAFETARLFPYRADRAAPRDVAIEPVHLHALVGPDDPHAVRMDVHRRIRVAAVDGGSARLVLEEAIRSSRRDEELDWRGDPAAVATLRLRPGAEATLGGVRLVVEGGAGDWRVSSIPGAAPWLELLPDATGFQGALLRISSRRP